MGLFISHKQWTSLSKFNFWSYLVAPLWVENIDYFPPRRNLVLISSICNIVLTHLILNTQYASSNVDNHWGYSWSGNQNKSWIWSGYKLLITKWVRNFQCRILKTCTVTCIIWEYLIKLLIINILYLFLMIIYNLFR